MRVPEISLENGLHAQNKHGLCRTISIQNDIDKLNTFQLTQFHLWWCQVCRAWEFRKDLPFGTYQIQEVAAPVGFVSDGEIMDVEVSYQGQDVEVVYEEAEFKNLPTVTAFTKSDLTTSVKLDGATLTVLDKEGNVIETWTSEKDEPHVIKRLHVGETYILREEFAPYGYLKAEEVEFTISDTADIQKVEMKDDVPTGRIIINKLGEFVGEVTWNDMVAGAVESAFAYITGSLQGVTFEVYALEDIKAADGVSDD